MVNTWDDKSNELDECIENSKANDAQLSRNTDGSAAISFTNEDAPRATARYSASSVRAARTVCLFVSFFGLVSYWLSPLKVCSEIVRVPKFSNIRDQQECECPVGYFI